MTQLERLRELNAYLLQEAPAYKAQAASFGADEAGQFRLFRSLVNIRMPKDASAEFLALQDAYLQTANREKGVTDVRDLTPMEDGLYLWQGDVTTLAVDAIVNAANSGLLGCFSPCHGCIDNAIHTYAGVQLRLACAKLMEQQGHEEPTGQAKLTPAFNLPSRYVIHTVGPIVEGEKPTEQDCALLASCYRACLCLAEARGATSIAFCCISTGVFRFPNEAAAKIAVQTVRAYREAADSGIRVVFNVFKPIDRDLYRSMLGEGRMNKPENGGAI